MVSEVQRVRSLEDGRTPIVARAVGVTSGRRPTDSRCHRSATRFEIGTGIAIGFALIPLRRHRESSEDLLRKGTVVCIAVAFFIYLLVSCLVHGTNPIDFLAATTIGSRSGYVPRTGLGFGIGSIIFLASCVGAYFAARKTLDVSRDETLDRW